MRKVLAAMLLLLVVGASSCVTRRESDAVIGAVYPTGGTQGPGGLQEYRGVQLASELANKTRRANGRRISLRLVPAESSDAAPSAVERLSRSGVEVIVGSYGSTISRAVASATSRRGLVFWETGAVGDLSMSDGLGRTVFRFPPTGVSLGRAAVSFMRDQYLPMLGQPSTLRYSVVYVDDVYGRSVGIGAREEIERSGLTLAAALPYRLTTVDYQSLAEQIRHAKTDVLIVVAYIEDGVALWRTIRDNKVPLVAAIGTSSSYCMPEFGRALGQDAVGVFASDKPDGDVIDARSLSPEAAKVLQWGRSEYEKRFDEPMNAPALSGFSAGWGLFNYVMSNAKSSRARDVAAAARKVRVPKGSLPNGSGLEFGSAGSEAGANLRATSVIWQWVAPNTRAVVWPATFSTDSIKLLPLR